MMRRRAQFPPWLRGKLIPEFITARHKLPWVVGAGMYWPWHAIQAQRFRNVRTDRSAPALTYTYIGDTGEAHAEVGEA